MSKAVSISEGGKGRIFPQTDKLKINNVGGGNSLWLPEEEVVTGTLYADENGIYLAENDGFSCYDTVVVRVEDETDPDEDDWELDPDELDEDVWDEESLEEFQEDPEAFEEKFNDKEKWKAEKAKKEKSQKIKKVKSLKPSKITGIDLVDGNPYEVGVDAEGNLTKEMLPSSIHIVVPPWKREYENGEEINFYGIHVYLLDKDGHPFKNEKYPTGEIPFEELLLPITIAEGEGGEAWEDDGISAVSTSYIQTTISSSYAYDTEPQNGYVTDISIGTYQGVPCMLGAEGDNYSPTTILLTKYGNQLYGAILSGTLNGVQLLIRETREPRKPYYGDYLCRGVTSASIGGSRFGTITWGEYAENIPNSSSNPSGVSVEDLSPVNGIPVQWMRSDGEMLEDKFSISITKDNNESGHSGTSDSGSGHTSGGF